MPTAPILIREANLSRAWIGAIRLLLDVKSHDIFHLVVQIERPSEEIPAVRRRIDALLRACSLPRVSSVANTIFPFAVARASSDSLDLAQRYRDKYWPQIRTFAKNRGGTYFLRMVDLPTGGSAGADQLNLVISKLRKSGRIMKTRYEVDLSDTLAIQIHSLHKDQQKSMGFPCLSFCAFQRDQAVVHLVAHYRNHFLTERSYGNWLGLGQLLEYVASQAGLSPGFLTIVAGHAEIERRTLRDVRVAVTDVERILSEVGNT
jgi:hypothetical protein